MSSQFDVASQALTLLGEDSVSAFSGSERAEICALTYSPFRRGIFGAYPWVFARTRIQLARLTASPTSEWTYAFSLPTDMAQLREVANSNAIGVRPMREGWERTGSEILSDETSIWVVYTKVIDEGLWPGAFEQFFVAAYAAHIAVPITGRTDLHNHYQKVAYGLPQEQNSGGLYRSAIAEDASSTPAAVVDDYQLVDARFGAEVDRPR